MTDVTADSAGTTSVKRMNDAPRGKKKQSTKKLKPIKTVKAKVTKLRVTKAKVMKEIQASLTAAVIGQDIPERRHRLREEDAAMRRRYETEWNERVGPNEALPQPQQNNVEHQEQQEPTKDEDDDPIPVVNITDVNHHDHSIQDIVQDLLNAGYAKSVDRKADEPQRDEENEPASPIVKSEDSGEEGNQSLSEYISLCRTLEECRVQIAYRNDDEVREANEIDDVPNPEEASCSKYTRSQ
ncbi:hypothetical protein R1sor_008566 [Riccia sorocarpa]|uniref:Uncharacterized protein n=1 Tax=Riccia sorocarpa TaxID=122646 RepID=A0ABD3HXD6_9MARC